MLEYVLQSLCSAYGVDRALGPEVLRLALPLSGCVTLGKSFPIVSIVAAYEIVLWADVDL